MFLGASYFRALGRDNVYGLSARGLAIDTVEPSGEEFPYFIEYWLVQPEPDAKSLVLYALLDSPTAAGAYRFEVTPGVETVVEVRREAVPPADAGEARHRSADQHVLLRREQHSRPSRTSGPRCTTPTACCCTSRAANGSGDHSTIRPGSMPRASRPRTRVASALIQRGSQLRVVPGHRDAIRAPAERLGRAGRRLGPRSGGARRDPERERAERQHRRLLGSGGAPGPGATAAFAYRLSWYGDDLEPAAPARAPSAPGATAAR